MATALATLRMDSGKIVVVDPRPGKGITSFDGKKTEETAKAFALQEQINSEIMAAATPVSGRIEILSRDGNPVPGLGIVTTKATDTIVYTTKPNERNKLKEPKHTTERDLAEITGYVLVSRDRHGEVRKGYTNEDATDFGRCIPITVEALTTLRGLLAPAA